MPVPKIESVDYPKRPHGRPFYGTTKQTPEEKKQKNREAQRRYYERNKDNPEWMQKNRDRTKKYMEKYREKIKTQITDVLFTPQED